MTIGKGVFGAEIFGRASLSSSLQSVVADVSCSYLINTLALQSLTNEYNILSSFAVVSDLDVGYTINNFDAKICIMGDSNASARGSFSQTTTSGATLYNVEGNLVPLADPWDGGTSLYSALHDGSSAGGSYVMHLADLLAAAGLETLWVPANKGGTRASDWAYNTSTTTCYGAMSATINAIGGVDVLIIHLGANDAIGAVSEASFVSTMNGILNQLRVDFPDTAIYLQKVHHNDSTSNANIDAIRSAVDTLWATNPNVLRGADLEGISTSIHYGQTGVPATCTSELNEVAARTYTALREVSTDMAISYAVNTIVAADLASSYAVRSAIAADLVVAHSINGGVSSAIAASYTILNAAMKDLANTFTINSAVSADLDSSFKVLNNVTADQSTAFSIYAAVQSDLQSSYNILMAGTVTAALTITYDISGAVHNDVSVGYAVQASVYQSLTTEFKVLQSAVANLSSAYAVISAAHADCIVSYSVFGTQPQFTLEELITAVRTAVEGSPVNVTQINGVTLVGNGTSASPWGPS